jgi:MoxR-like ATPase
VHVAARLAQLDEVLQRAADACEAVRQRQAALQAALAPRLWMPPDLQQRLQAAHGQTLACWKPAQRLQQVRAGFAALPLEDATPRPAPKPPHRWLRSLSCVAVAPSTLDRSV